MENNDYIDLIKEAYEKLLQAKQETIDKQENQDKKLLQAKQETIDKQETQITYLRNLVDQLLNKLNAINEQLKYVNIEITNKNEGGNMSNNNQISSGAGDNNNNQLDNVTIGESYTGRDVINHESSSNLEEIVDKINQLIEQNSQTNPNNNTSDRLKIASIVIEHIETNPTWKQKAIKACQQGLLEAMKSNPIGAFVAGAIEGWKEQ